MKAIAITRAATDGNNIEFLQEIDLPMPVATGHDLLVEVQSHFPSTRRYQGPRRF